MRSPNTNTAERKKSPNAGTCFVATLWLALVLTAISGCRRSAVDTNQNPFPAVAVGETGGGPTLPNPLSVPVADQEFLWNQLTDEVEDYFKIRRQERTRIVDNIITEGWIETYPTIGSTIPEKWRKDSTRGYEKLHATLQTVRRWARIRVIPDTNSYLLDVQVYKELEDLEYPQHSSVGNVLVEHSATPHFDDDPSGQRPDSYGWIPLGRDVSLEQRILQRLQSRLTQQSPAPKPARGIFKHLHQ